LFKLGLYLIIYLHLVACFIWSGITVNCPTIYYLSTDLTRYVRDYSDDEFSKWQAQGLDQN
jgi:hypothetical protein